MKVANDDDDMIIEILQCVLMAKLLCALKAAAAAASGS